MNEQTFGNTETTTLELNVEFKIKSIFENSDYRDWDTHESIIMSYSKPMLTKYLSTDGVFKFLDHVKEKGYHLKKMSMEGGTSPVIVQIVKEGITDTNEARYKADEMFLVFEAMTYNGSGMTFTMYTEEAHQ